MNLWPYLTLVLTLFTFPAERPNARLRGCPDVPTLAAALRHITNSDWRRISETRLQSMWPTELRPRDCIRGHCGSLQGDDRVINAECQCCEKFLFVSDDGSEQLENIIVWYSADQRSDTVAAGKKLSEALGLPPMESAAIGRKRISTYWTVDKQAQIVAVMQVEIVGHGATWAAYLNVSRHQMNEGQ